MAAFNENRSHEVDEGVILSEGGAGVFSGGESPVGTSGPAGSLYLRTNGELWKKTGSGDNDWSQVSGGGLDIPTHKALDQLVHNIAETSYEEITRVNGVVSSIILWVTSAKIQKIREEIFTRTSGLISIIVKKQYNAVGNLIETLTGTISRTGSVVDTIDWVFT